MVGSADKVNWLIGYSEIFLGKWRIKWSDFAMAHHSSCTSNLYKTLMSLSKLGLPVVTL